MSNVRLRLDCPACRGTGRVSYLRSGAWINRHCPGLNGPVDVDSSLLTHELDNLSAQRLARIEYKRPSEPITAGQELHFSAVLRSVAPPWNQILVLVVDAGQTSAEDLVDFRWKTTRAEDTPWREADTTTVDELGRRIAAWLWPVQAVAA